MTLTPYLSLSSSSRPWDDGLRWHIEQTAAEGPDFSLDPLQLAFVRDQHLRSPNGTLEDEYIEWLIRVSYRQAEQWTNRWLIPQTVRQVMSGFPWGDIYTAKAPLIAVTSLDYIDSDGAAAEFAGSPAEYTVIAPSQNTRGRIQVLSGSSWPSAYRQDDSVTLTLAVGYPVVDGVASIPEDITDGRLLWIGERWKQRSLTDHAFNQNKAAIQARALWMQYRIY